MSTTTKLVVVLVALATVACKGKDKTATKPPVADPAVDAQAKAVADLSAAIGGLPSPTTQRDPMRPTPGAAQDPRASSYYAKAAEHAKPVLASDEVRDELTSYFDRWMAAAPSMRALGAEGSARSTAEAIELGAGAPAGASPVELGGDYAAYVGTAAVAIAAALESSAAGSADTSAWQLLGVVRLGQDLARGASYEGASSGSKIMGMALAALRSVATTADRKKFSNEALIGLLEGCQRVRSTQFDYTDILVSDLRYQGEAVIALAAPAGDAAAPSAPSDALKAALDAHGGITGLAAKLVGQAGIIAALKADETKRAAPRQELMLAESKKVWGEAGHPSLDINRFGRWLLAGADLDGTCIVLALELDRRTRKKGELAPTLDALTPKPLAESIIDPLGDKPWEYVDDGFGGRLLRSMPIILDDKTATVEMRIEKRAK